MVLNVNHLVKFCRLLRHRGADSWSGRIALSAPFAAVGSVGNRIKAASKDMAPGTQNVPQFRSRTCWMPRTET